MESGAVWTHIESKTGEQASKINRVLLVTDMLAWIAPELRKTWAGAD